MDAQTLWYVSRATGAVAQILLTGVMVLGIMTAGRGTFARLSRAAVLRLHRNLALGAVVFTAVHITSAIVDGYVPLKVADVLVPFGSAFDPLWTGLGAIAVDLVIAVTITSLLRRHLSAYAWRAIHLCSYALWPFAVAHGWGTGGGDSTSWWMISIDVVCIVAVVVALIVMKGRRPHPDTAARLSAARHHVASALPPTEAVPPIDAGVRRP